MIVVGLNKDGLVKLRNALGTVALTRGDGGGRRGFEVQASFSAAGIGASTLLSTDSGRTR